VAGGTKTTKIQVAMQATGTKQVVGALNQVGNATQQIGKQQTRMGQASASAGRQFSAQANGLGGLVGAYAGAAANIFAITAAFTALSRAAKFEQIIAGTNALASSIGANGQNIIATVQNITKAQLNLLETAQTVNIGLAAGFNTTQIEQLSDVSLRASKALGRDLTDAFTRVSRGAAKLEPELLDELGIFTRIDPAVKKYADSVGKSVSSLTNFERRQAFANAVIEEGSRKFRDVDTSTATVSESFERLAATVVNVGLSFGSLLATGLAPLADFISGNLSNALAAFGVLATIIGSRAASALAAGINTATLAITAFGNNVATKINQVSGNFAKAQAAVSQYAAAVNLPRLGNLQLRAEAQSALQAAAAQTLLTQEELKGAQASLIQYRAKLQANIASGAYTKNLRAARLAVVELYLAERKLRPAIIASGGAASFASRGFNALAVAVGFAGRQLASLVSRLFTIITIVSLAQLALDSLAKAFGFDGFNIIETLLGYIKSIYDWFTATSRNVTLFSNSFRSDMMTAAESAGVFGEEASEAVDAAIEKYTDLFKLIEQINLTPQADVDAAMGLAGVSVQVRTIEGMIEELIAEGDSKSIATAKALQVLNSEIQKFGVITFEGLKNTIFQINAVGKAAGLSSKQIRELFQNIRTIEGVTGEIDSLTGTLAITVDNFRSALQKETPEGILEFKEGFLDLSAALSSGTDKVNDFYEAFNIGTLDAEKAAQAVSAIGGVVTDLDTQRERNIKKIAAIEAQLGNRNIIGKQRERLETTKLELEEAQKGIDAAAQRLTIEQDIVSVLSNRLAEIEKVGKLLDKIYGKPGEKLDRLTLSGALGGNAEFALTAREKEANAAQRLVDIVAKGRKIESDPQLINYFKQREEISARIAKLNQDLANNEGFRAEQENISIKLQEERNNLKKVEAEITADNLEALKNANTATQQLALLQERLVSLGDEVFKQEQQLYALRIKNYDLILKSAEIRDKKDLQDTKTLLQLEKQRLDNQRAFREAAGTLIGQDDVGFSIAQGKLTIAAAKADKDFALAQAKREEDRANNTFIQQKNQLEADLKVRKLNLDATLSLIDALNANTLETTNLLRAQQGLEPLTRAPGQDVDENGLTLRQRFDEAFSTFSALSRDNLLKTKENAIAEAELKTQSANDSFKLLKNSTTNELALKIFNANETVKLFQAVNDVLVNEVSEGINSFVDALIEGKVTLDSAKEAFRSFFYSILKGVQEAVLEQTLITPITNAITNNLGKIFGLDQIAEQSMEQAAAATTAAAGASASATVAASITSVGTALTASATTLGTQVAAAIIPIQTALTSVGTQISLAVNTMATQIQIAATTAVARINAAVAAATATSTAGSFLAAGGNVKKLAGGGSNQLRDRVAAMLEPGEFVVRKEAAKKLGMAKLQKMNSGNGNIFEMLGMNPVKKVGGGHPGLSDSSAANTSGMAGGSYGGGSLGFGGATGDLASRGVDVSNRFGGGDGGGGNGNSWASDFGKKVASQVTTLANQSLFGGDPYYSAAQDYLSKGYGTGDSTQSAIALSVIGKSFGMPGDIDPENARDIERKIDLAKKGKKMFGDDNVPFDLKKAYQDANKGFIQTAIEAAAPKTFGGLLLTAATLGGVPGAKEVGYLGKGIQGYQEGKLMEEFESMSDYLEFKERQRMTMSQAKAVGGAIRLMAGGGSVNSRDRVPEL
jgi:hypothetical protein